MFQLQTHENRMAPWTASPRNWTEPGHDWQQVLKPWSMVPCPSPNQCVEPPAPTPIATVTTDFFPSYTLATQDIQEPGFWEPQLTCVSGFDTNSFMFFAANSCSYLTLDWVCSGPFWVYGNRRRHRTVHCLMLLRPRQSTGALWPSLAYPLYIS